MGQLGTNNMNSVLGIIGGSGLYDIDGLENTEWKSVESPFGETSDDFLCGELNGQKLVFLPRHGRGHRIPPDEINYRANIDAMKRLGVTEILAIGAVGSLKEELPPGTFVIVDQFIDRTINRKKSFFTKGLVAHVSMAHPTCDRLATLATEAAEALDIAVVKGGTYLAMEGPQFSSIAESELYRSWGCDVIGMTNMPEAKLAREAEICYSTVAMVTDFDCWHTEHDNVEVTDIIKVLLDNAHKGGELIKQISPQMADLERPCPCGCQQALEHAIITSPDARTDDMVTKLDAVAGRILNKS